MLYSKQIYLAEPLDCIKMREIRKLVGLNHHHGCCAEGLMCWVTRAKHDCLEPGDSQKALGVKIIPLPEVLESRGCLGGPRFCLGHRECLAGTVVQELASCMFVCG